MKKYDYIMIGSGPSARTFTNLLAKTNKTALIVEGDKFGGICPNYGCTPKAFLEGATRAVLFSEQLKKRGLKNSAKIDWPELMRTKKEYFAKWPSQTRANLDQHFDTKEGYARFVNNKTIQVGDDQFTADKIIIEAGNRPNRLSIPGEELTHNSYEAFALESLPAHIALIGAGYVSMELATLFAAAGARVDVIEFSSRALRQFDKEQVAKLVELMSKRGIHFHFNAGAKSVSQVDNHYLVETTDGQKIKSDYVIDASGRRPNVEHLNLAATDIKNDRNGILVDDHLQTAAPGVYAIGDVVSRKQPKLTPVGQFEAKYLFALLEKQVDKPIHYPVVGTGVFTFPQIAQAGLTPEKAPANYQVSVINFQDSFHGGKNDLNNQLKLVFDDHEQLVGASEISDNAIDDLNYYIPVIGMKLKEKDLRQNFISIFPTMGGKVVNVIK